MQLMDIEKMQQAVEGMHKDVNDRVTRNRERHIAQHNKRANILKPSFNVGEFVLINELKIRTISRTSDG